MKMVYNIKWFVTDVSTLINTISDYNDDYY